MNMTVICQYRCLFMLNLLPKIKKKTIENKSIMLNSIMWCEFVSFNTFSPLGLN